MSSEQVSIHKNVIIRQGRSMKHIKRISSVIFIAVIAATADSEPKPYQTIMLNEPATLMDMTVYAAELDIKEFNSQFPGAWVVENDDIDWLIEPKDENTQHTFSVRYLTTTANFDFAKGQFYFYLERTWVTPEPDKNYLESSLDYYKANGVSKLTQRNVGLYCKLVLERMSQGLFFSPFQHKGYTTGGTRKLTDNLWSDVERDTEYRVEIKYNSKSTGETLTADCRYTKHPDTYEFKPERIVYNFRGGWHDLEAIVQADQELKYDENGKFKTYIGGNVIDLDQ